VRLADGVGVVLRLVKKKTYSWSAVGGFFTDDGMAFGFCQMQSLRKIQPSSILVAR
jgi:hypothetical protein